jgi:hypothetical protein
VIGASRALWESPEILLKSADHLNFRNKSKLVSVAKAELRRLALTKDTFILSRAPGQRLAPEAT